MDTRGRAARVGRNDDGHRLVLGVDQDLDGDRCRRTRRDGLSADDVADRPRGLGDRRAELVHLAGWNGLSNLWSHLDSAHVTNLGPDPGDAVVGGPEDPASGGGRSRGAWAAWPAGPARPALQRFLDFFGRRP